jgi:DnaJ-domain-containing protein 1
LLEALFAHSFIKLILINNIKKQHMIIIESKNIQTFNCEEKQNNFENIIWLAKIIILMEKYFYKILSVERGIDEKELKKAYRNLAMKLHSDKNLNNVDET